MPLLALPFPAIDPVLIQIGPFAIRWYALAYIVGLVLGWQYLRWLVRRPGWQLTPRDARRPAALRHARRRARRAARLHPVLPAGFLPQPTRSRSLKVWEGGMSFHGGLLGVVVGDRACSRAGAASRSSRSATRSPARRRSACSSAGSPTSSTASSGAGRPTCPGRWSSRAAARCRAIRASSTRRRSRASCCSRSWPGSRSRPRAPGTEGRLARHLPDRLRHRAQRRRAVPRAGRPSRLPARRPDHGPAAVAADDAGRPGAGRLRSYRRRARARASSGLSAVLTAEIRRARAALGRPLHGAGARPSDARLLPAAAIRSGPPATS